MANKNDFISLLQETLEVSSRNSEWKSLKNTVLYPFYNEYFGIIKSFYLALLGREHNEKIINIIVPLVVGLPISRLLGLGKIYSGVQDSLKDILVEDSQLHSVQKFFPHFSGEVDDLIALQNNRAPFSVPFRIFISLAGADDNDLIESTDVLGVLLERYFISENVNRCYESLGKKKYKDCDLYSLNFIREFVSKYVLLATQKPIPEVSKDNFKGLSKSLYEESEKFGVKNEIDSLFIKNKEEIYSILDDIIEIFKDFPDSTTRSKALKSFEKQIRAISL